MRRVLTEVSIQRAQDPAYRPSRCGDGGGSTQQLELQRMLGATVTHRLEGAAQVPEAVAYLRRQPGTVRHATTNVCPGWCRLRVSAAAEP